MHGFVDYLELPSEVSEFEAQYLRRMNRIALVFFVCHLPFMALVAALCDTGVFKAVWMTAMLLAGPLFAYYTMTSPRRLSLVYGVTAMCMGGLLVHFGQGPMQIEMHFYFFVLLALLVVFANPTVILVSAATVASHHLILYFLLPRSVFNYDASIWAVVVHALFVVLESAAACFVARSFFDNVIGLEKIVTARTRELDQRSRDMRRLLDHIGEGIVSMNRDGTLSDERSHAADVWLGTPTAKMSFSAYVERAAPGFAEWFDLGWESVCSEVMPLEVALAQLPRSVEIGARSIGLSYTPVLENEKLTQLLIVLSDLTDSIARKRVEASRHEDLCVFERLMTDRLGVIAFLEEAHAIAATLGAATPLPIGETRRLLHTLKGNASMYQLQTLVALCHQLESEVEETNAPLSVVAKARLDKAWAEIANRLRTLLGKDKDTGPTDSKRADESRLLTAIARGASHRVLAEMVSSWSLEPARQRLLRLGEQARQIATRLGKSDLVIEAKDNGVRLHEAHFAEFWSACVHVVRNAVDHGVETAGERALRQAVGPAKLSLRSHIVGARLAIEIEDNGRGIDWHKLEQRAKQTGLACATHADLVEAMFVDGITTKDSANEYSGRGVGMGAVRAACQALGGKVDVSSEPGSGTLIRFSWPITILGNSLAHDTSDLEGELAA